LGLNKVTDDLLVTSQHWAMRLPSDWKEVPEHAEGTIYLVSADESKGLYLGTWERHDTLTPEQVLEHYKKVQLETAPQADQGTWEVINAESGQTGGVSTLTLDMYNQASNYRVMLRVLVRLPIIVRAAFHDYWCEDLKTSTDYFSPLISSLHIVEAQQGVPADVARPAGERRG